MKQWLENLASNHPIRLGLVIFGLVALVVTTLSLPFWLNNPAAFLENIMAEAHGLLFDLLVVGVVLTWLNRLGMHRQTVQRHLEEIDDYRDWRGAEVTYRITGIIRRLNRLGITEIDLKGVFLKEARLRGISLRGAQLQRATLQGANLWEADLEDATLWKATLEDAVLWDASLKHANLERANLHNCKLHSANLQGANLQGANLQGANLQGANLRDTNLDNISYDDQTCWPADFRLAAGIPTTYTEGQPPASSIEHQAHQAQPSSADSPTAFVTQKLPSEESDKKAE